MRGEQPALRDINVDLEELVIPAPLLAEESLSPDADPEEEERQPYTIDTCCVTCKSGVRITIVATSAAVRTLQLLLFSELGINCTRCSKQLFRHGRS
jgi:hypothetical protein|uniref:Protein E7 n=1 Tax=Human papillomavirus TaxID=10566 RepID=A0A385PPN6_9PAPI|nr:MAG: E7 protein [Human papillomavirus]